MTRQLRARASRPNYAELAGLDAEDDIAGPSTSDHDIIESDGSGSEFEPDAAAPEEQAQDDAEDMALDDDGDGDAEAEDDNDESASAAPRKRTAPNRGRVSASASAIPGPSSRRKNAQPKATGTGRRSIALLPGLAHSSGRQMNALPSLHHRHRSMGICGKQGKIERLTKAPIPFEEGRTVQTNAWASSSTISDRVNKSWGYNVGPGPLWELLEDRTWFKEAAGSSRTTERELRPRVHERIATGQLQVLSPEEATPYLPSDVKTVDEGNLRPPPLIACSFGPFGKQTRIEMNMFDTVKISRFFTGSKSHVFNAGAPVWALDWCPIHPDDRPHHEYKQYLAVAPFPSRHHSPMVGSRVQRPSAGCIQIWSLGPSHVGHEDVMKIDECGEDVGDMRCEMVMCVDSGPAYELKWCPLPSNDPTTKQDSPRKLGVIAGTFEDGSLTFYAVPDPTTLQKPGGQRDGSPIYVKLTEPLLRIELEETSCWSFDWANSEVVAIGCTNGSIAVYDIARALDGRLRARNQLPLLPTHYFTVHQSAIRSLAWVRAPVFSASGEQTPDNPTVIVSGGYDGVECVTDIRDMCGNVMNRTRDVVTAMCFSPYSGSAVTIDHENIIKAYSVSPSMLGRGHTILEPNGPIWSIAPSDHHPQLAVGVTDGSCLTTNTMRSTRRGGLIPFLEHKVYQLDYSRALQEYRMLEHFVPKETQNRPTATRQNKVISTGTGAWPPEVGVQRVVWNDGNGLACAPLLASATGAGLCRVDWLLGRWGRDPPPYNGVEGMRGETTGVTFDEDDESD
ncbi:WD40-repeat-containing domain protein [Fomes fomentarius]|nr:WD40-repeat-containing domain protein [Fomes fomentarius]